VNDDDFDASIKESFSSPSEASAPVKSQQPRPQVQAQAPHLLRRIFP
jgi:hypothetical protein